MSLSRSKLLPESESIPLLETVIDITPEALSKTGRLRKNRQEIARYLALFNRTLRKRNLAIQIPMLIIMLGTITMILKDYFDNQSFEANTFTQKVGNETLVFANESREALTHLMNQTQSVYTHLEQFKGVGYQIEKVIKATLFTMTCPGRFPSTLNFGCLPRLNHQCNHPQDLGEPHYFGANFGILKGHENDCFQFSSGRRGPSFILNDRCPPLIQNYCNNHAELTAVTKNLTMLHNQIQNLSTISNAAAMTLPYYLLAIGLGEISPLAIIAITLLTHVFSDCFPSWSWFLSADEKEEVNHFSAETAIPESKSYTSTVSNYQNKMLEIEQELQPNNCATTVMMSKKEKVEDAPISLMFHDKLAAPQLFRPIFEFANFDPTPTYKENAALTRKAFEMGGHAKNEQRKELNGIVFVNPLFSFFKAVKSDSKTREKIMPKIYEFAGLIPS